MPIRIHLKVTPRVVRDPSKLVVRATFQNTERVTIRFNPTIALSPTLALEVRDSQRAMVPLGPPPLPPQSDPRIDLRPGGKYPVVYRRFLPDTVSSDEYEIRLRYRDVSADLHTDWQRFKIRR